MSLTIKLTYTDPDNPKKRVTFSQLRKSNIERQIEIMRTWFLENYQEAQGNCPWDPEDHNFMFIWGGPYDPENELTSEFDGLVKEKAIAKLASELTEQWHEWSGIEEPDEDDYYEIEIGLSLEFGEPIENLQFKLAKLKKLLLESNKIDEGLHHFQYMMIHTFCITSLETYLSDVFSQYVFQNTENKNKYLKYERKLSEQKFSLGEIQQKYEKLDDIIKKELLETSFHNFNRVPDLFKDVLDINLKELADIQLLTNAINNRHDAVHRGGKNKKGQEIKFNSIDIKKLIDDIEQFCKAIDQKIQHLRK